MFDGGFQDKRIDTFRLNRNDVDAVIPTWLSC